MKSNKNSNMRNIKKGEIAMKNNKNNNIASSKKEEIIMKNNNTNSADTAKKDENSMANYRIIAKNEYVLNDSYKTQLNNNDLIIGATGCGKTRGYVLPNIYQLEGKESIVVTDTKGDLFYTTKDYLLSQDYTVMLLDFENPENSQVLNDKISDNSISNNDCTINEFGFKEANIGIDYSSFGYNPLDFISYYEPHCPSEKDIKSLTYSMCINEFSIDPYWERQAAIVLDSIIGYVMETSIHKNERTFSTVNKLFTSMNKTFFAEIFGKLECNSPDSNAVKAYKQYKALFDAEKTISCVQGFVSIALSPFTTDDIFKMFCANCTLNFANISRRPTALFLKVSDIDRSRDVIINYLYADMIKALFAEANLYNDRRLRIPVRIILDDFAANTVIPDFDKTISVTRSRNISFSLILQSITQLDSMYDHSKSRTILNNCDHTLYLGGQDTQTVELISKRLNIPFNAVIDMPLDKAVLFRRGKPGKMLDKIDFCDYQLEHPEKFQIESADSVDGILSDMQEMPSELFNNL